MDLKRKFIGSLLVLVASAGLLAACGADDDDCEIDADCDVETQFCNKDEGVCEDKAGPSDTCKVAEDCDKDKDEICVIPDGEEAGKCEVQVQPTPGYFTVLIKDTSKGDSCTDTSADYKTPGSQITYVRLESVSDGLDYAYGTAISAEITGDSEYADYAGVLDGSTPAFADANGLCVAKEDVTRKNDSTKKVNTGFRKDSGVAIGCEGKVYVTFKKDGETVTLTDDYVVRVGEYDKVCDDLFSEGKDFYEVYLCKGIEGADVKDLDCSLKISDGELTGLQDTSDIPVEAAAAE